MTKARIAVFFRSVLFLVAVFLKYASCLFPCLSLVVNAVRDRVRGVRAEDFRTNGNMEKHFSECGT